MNQNKNKDQRRLPNFLINPSYQFKYVFWITFTGITLLILNSSVFYYFIKQNYKILVDLSPMEDVVKVQLHRELKQILVYLTSFSILFIAVISLFATILSHRTAGPMYHFKRIFSDIQKGDLTARIHLRPKDDFQDVAQECNKMIDYLTAKKRS